MRFVVAKGHESTSQQGSRRTSDHRIEDNQQFLSAQAGGFPPAIASYDGRDSIGDDSSRYYDDSSPYYYDYELGPADPSGQI